VRSFIDYMPWYADLDLLMSDLHDLFVRSFRIENYQIILRDETNRVFNAFRTYPEDPARPVPELKAQSAILRYFEWGKGEYLSLQRHHLRLSPGSIEREAGIQLEEFGAQFCFPLASQSEAFGLLLIGKKSGDEPFTATDINLLVSLVKNMSLMVNQIRLKNQILQTQELDLLGRMSRGMAHDLNNLLTPVWTLLQLSSEMGSEAFDEELLPVAQRNIKTMRAYIREALFFSENLRPDLQLSRLDLVIQQAVDLARTSRKKEVEVISITPGEILVEIDEVLMQRLIANLISNAIDASRPHSQIHVHLDRLPRTDEQDWLRIRVVDQGEGIPKEDLGRILRPYFTTKNRGDETRGFGLGLAICRKIVNLHGGNLSIASVVKKGTTVQVDLPSRQVRPVSPPVVANAA
jgi:signal transduction histidine kinase